MLAHVEPFWTWHTPFAWTGYILLVDGIVYRLRGSSWLTTNRREFIFLAIVSIPLWVVFEGYNLLIENWYYINCRENLIVRYFGYAWAFATISPGIFQTAELVAALRGSTADSRLSRCARLYRLLDYRLSTVDCRLRHRLCASAPRCSHGPWSGHPRTWRRRSSSDSSSCWIR